MFCMEEWTKILVQEFPVLLDITESYLVMFFPTMVDITKY